MGRSRAQELIFLALLELLLASLLIRAVSAVVISVAPQLLRDALPPFTLELPVRASGVGGVAGFV